MGENKRSQNDRGKYKEEIFSMSVPHESFHLINRWWQFGMQVAACFESKR